ncbi:AAA family ATPase [Paludisphaera mucosa]|uniref:AAA family ATPase n=1 Tax=Paludisphaera mucosa TaxID=3030827 RepID=A0ABT6FGB0_9BACT|nr:AAA family ATPase [Paludisphaera mucosa]MDG3006616.1 AAA family ATPase [Paludisphaera mucosa]
MKLGGYVGAGLLREDEVRSKLASAAKACGLGTDGDPGEGERAITNGIEIGKATPKTIPGPNGRANGHHPAVPVHPNGTPAVSGPLTKKAGDFETRPVEWLWPNRIPKRKLTTAAGSGGLGKSFVFCDLAARVSVGGEIPGMGGECFEVGNVLIINCEDDPEDTTVPRLMEAGADLRRIWILRPEHLGRFTLAEVDMIKRVVAEEMGGSVALVIIDPATAFVGKADDHKNAQLQALLGPLRTAAWEIAAAIILVTHINKASGGGNVEAAMRVVGGVAWVNAVRAALIFVKDPDDPAKRLMIPFKNNNGPEQKGLAYRVAPTEALARIEWEGEVDTTADEAMGGSASKPGPKSRLTDEQIDAIVGRLFEGRNQVPSSEGTKFLRDQGVPFDKIKSTRNRLGIRAKQLASGWVWIASYGLRNAPPAPI